MITGGAGYIGSHTALFLLQNDCTVTVIDNLLNSSQESLNRVEVITGKKINFYELDLRETDQVNRIFEIHKFDAVIHFAGLKAVGESVEKPLDYYENNIESTLSLLKCMKQNSVSKIVFSSSATVYNDPEFSSKNLAYDEDKTIVTRSSNPYGTTKTMQEWILQDIANAGDIECIALRYFNPVGAHESGEIGEDPKGIPNNLTPYITQVAIGKREKLQVWGNDYPTSDGTCIRDYIHVMDLARSHYLALMYLVNLSALSEGSSDLENHKTAYFNSINVGSGKGYSVLEVLHAFENAVGAKIPYEIASRRAGDLPFTVAKTDKARQLLGFEVSYNIEQMAKDAWNWQRKNPNGFN